MYMELYAFVHSAKTIGTGSEDVLVITMYFCNI
jgi:hypothetical protein